MNTEDLTYEDIHQLLAQHRYSAAIATLSGIVLESPDDAQAWSLLGQAYTEAGFHTEAIAVLMRAVLLDDEGPATSEALGVAWLRRGELATARTWFHRALTALDAGDRGTNSRGMRGSILRNLAMSLIMEEREQAARFLLEEAFEVNPADILTLHALSGIYINAGEYQEALPLVDTILGARDVPSWIRDAAQRGREIIGTHAGVA